MADKSIRVVSSTVAGQSADWEMVDALMDGTAAMRVGGRKWLPKFPMESDTAYDERLATAVLHPVFKRTVLVNAARPFSRPMSLGENTPDRVTVWAADVDLQGTTLGAFAVRLMAQCLSKGLSGVLVEYPKAQGIRTQAEEKAVGARPYCVNYSGTQILGWKSALGSNGLQLSQLRLLEFEEEDAGEFATRTVEQVRVLEPGKWTVYRKNEKVPDQWDVHEQGTTSLSFIPFVFFYGIKKGFGVGLSPLRDLAYQNVEHYQSASDQQTILHVARVPILFARMFGETALTIGAGSAASANDKDADLKYVEHTGAAIEAGQVAIDKLEDRMRATGAELISLKPGYTTATEVSSDGESTKSLLQQITEVFEESLEAVLEYMGAWVKEPAKIEVELYKDFGPDVDTDPQTLGSAVSSKTISRQTHFEELQRRDVLSGDREWTDEKTRLDEDAADAADKQAEQQRKLNAVGGTGPGLN